MPHVTPSKGHINMGTTHTHTHTMYIAHVHILYTHIPVRARVAPRTSGRADADITGQHRPRGCRVLPCVVCLGVCLQRSVRHMCVSPRLYIYIYMYVCIYIYTHTDIHTHTNSHAAPFALRAHDN